MKKQCILTGMVLLSCISNLWATNLIQNDAETMEYYKLAKVWGYLKYFSPVVKEGGIDWDSTLLNSLHIIQNRPHEKDSGIRYLIRAAKADHGADNKHIVLNVADTNLRWIEDTAFLGQQICDRLLTIYAQPGGKSNYYVKCDPKAKYLYYCNESAYKELGFPGPRYRLLGLFRVWNIVNYFYPYRNMLNNWDSVLYTFIPKVLHAGTPTQYGLVLSQLLSQIKDSHVDLMYPHLSILGCGIKYYPPFEVRIIENKLVVTDIYNQDKKDSNDVQLGDILIQRTDMTDFSQFQDSFSRYIQKSNNAYTGYKIGYDYIFPAADSFVSYNIIRRGRKKTISARYLDLKDWLAAQDKYLQGKAAKWLRNDVGYVNLCKINYGQIDSIFSRMVNAKAIIFDMRGYPEFPWPREKISKWLFHNKRAYLTTISPDFEHPGRFIKQANAAEYSIFHKHYKGQIFILVNERTISLAEGNVMMIQAANRVTTVGTQTAGADGPASRICIPGNIWFWITESGIEYPDGTPSQRKGVKIDVYARLTAKGIAEGRDEVLETALKLVK